MSLSTHQKNDVQAMVLTELDHLFSGLTEKYNSAENHDMVLFLLDIESKLKQALNEMN